MNLTNKSRLSCIFYYVHLHINTKADSKEGHKAKDFLLKTLREQEVRRRGEASKPERELEQRRQGRLEVNELLHLIHQDGKRKQRKGVKEVDFSLMMIMRYMMRCRTRGSQVFSIGPAWEKV